MLRGHSEKCTTSIKGIEISAVGWKDNIASTFVGEEPKTRVTTTITKHTRRARSGPKYCQNKSRRTPDKNSPVYITKN